MLEDNRTIQIKRELDKLVNAVEKEIENRGFFIASSTLNYLKENFGEKGITLILRNLGIKKLDQGEYGNAERIFQQAIAEDQNNPYLYIFWGIAKLHLAKNANEVKDAKEQLDKAKQLLKNEKPSKYKEDHLTILKKYLDYFRSNWKERFFTWRQDKKEAIESISKEPKFQQIVNNPTGSVAQNVEGNQND